MENNNFQKTYTEIIRELYSRSVEESGSNKNELHYLVSPDGTFLGKLTSNKYDPKSIFNTYGAFGSNYSNTSIFNEYGPYGGFYSDKSPFNKYATSPPKIFVDSKYYGSLTKNTFLPNARDTDLFLEMVTDNEKFSA